MRISGLGLGVLAMGIMAMGCEPAERASLDSDLRAALQSADVDTLDPGPGTSPAQVELGRALFFDKILSGNKDTSCATCHHPLLHTGDGLCTSIGTGGAGLGSSRRLGEGRELIPRNAPEIFNRGAPLWTSMFWDSRVSGTPYEDGTLETPAGSALPDGIPSPLAAQALFPPTSAAEMRGSPGDLDVNGEVNTIANIDGADVEAIWAALMERLLAIDAYQDLFAAAFPQTDAAQLNFGHAAQAIAAFEVDAFTLLDAPFDRYLAGDDGALSAQAKRGGLLFYGEARCSKCHTGSLLTDQKHHNIAVPQLGPGRGEAAPYDIGRMALTQMPEDKFAFRTPALRNTALTGPWMHNGAYLTLEDAVRHHFNAEDALRSYDPGEIPEMFAETIQDDEATLQMLLANVAPRLGTVDLSDKEFDDLMAFLDALTDPRAGDMDKLTPLAVPSGLPLAD
jgi:cytochrome c peroxidase